MRGCGVIFDMDGVLVDSYRAHLESWRRSAQARGTDITEQQFAESFGRTSRDIIRLLWPDKVATDRDVARWDADKEAAYREILREDFPEMDGAGDLIAALDQAGFVMAIGSSGPPENVRTILECLPNADRIAATVDGTQVTHGKPHPEVFLKAAAKIGIEPPNCAVLEDAPAGVEAARRAGMAAIALTGTAPRERFIERAHVVVGSLRELTPERIAATIQQNRDSS